MTEKPPLSASLKGKGLPYYAAVGQAASTWNHLESRVDLAIIYFAKESADVISCLLAQMLSINAKLDALVAIVQYETRSKIRDKTVRRLIKFTQDVRPLAMKRNRIIHDPLILEGEEVRILRLTTKSPRGKLVFDIIPFDLKEINEFIRKATDCYDEFNAIRDQINSDLRGA